VRVEIRQICNRSLLELNDLFESGKMRFVRGKNRYSTVSMMPVQVEGNGDGENAKERPVGSQGLAKTTRHATAPSMVAESKKKVLNPVHEGIDAYDPLWLLAR